MNSRFLRSIVSVCLASGLIAGAAWADDAPPKKPWKNATEASLVSTNGNTKTTTYAAKDTFNLDYKKTGLELIGGALGSDNNNQTTAEQYVASEKGTYKLTDRNYVFEKFGWGKDRFAGYENRYDSSVGLGRDLVKSATNLLTFELGGGYVQEERVTEDVNNFTSGRAYSKYTHTFTPTASFTQDAEYLHNFDHPADFRVNTETALISALSVHFSLKVGYKWRYVAEPPTGFGKSDTTTNVALIATY